MTGVDRARLGVFFGILLAFAAGLVAVSEFTDLSAIALAPVYMFTPLLAGAAVVLVNSVSFSEVGLRVGRPLWLAAAPFVALALVGVTLIVAVAVPGVGFDPSVDPVPGLSLPAGVLGVLATFGLVLALGATVNALFAFGEEFGWRGYLLWELAPLGFWKASALIGAVWGLWHAPIIVEGYNYASFPIVGIGMMVAACVAFSPVYTYLVLRAESVAAAALFHGVFNGSAGIVIAYAVADGVALRELVASPVGVAGIVAFGLAAAAIAATGTLSLTRPALVGGDETDATTRR